MAPKGKQSLLKSVRQRRFLNKEFQSFRADLVEYARTYYPDRINDFSEASMGGALLDFAAYVGDVMSFYLDHQFSELDPETAVEDINIERGLRNAGVEISGASPSAVNVTFFIEVPAVAASTGFAPKQSCLATIKEGTKLVSDSGVEFNLTEDIDFSETNQIGELLADITISETNNLNEPISFVLTRTGLCISGQVNVDTFEVGEFIPFRRLTLASPDVSDIISVTDSDGNTYYQVDSLSQDSVYTSVANVHGDNDIVDNSLELRAAPYRFISETSLVDRTTTVIFGGGNADTVEDDIIPDPSEFAIPLFGKKTFSRFSLDPNQLLNSPTLGVAKSDTTVRVVYRNGGGLSHNVEANAINTIEDLVIVFPDTVSAGDSQRVVATVDIINEEEAAGGDDALTTDELKGLIQSARNSQNRIVTKQDLLSRIYTMPSNFGRVFRAGIRPATNNPLTSELYIVSRNSAGNLTTAPDTLKKNLKTYLNDFRLVSDAIDILDAPIINISVNFEVIVDIAYDRNIVLQDVLEKVKEYFDVKNFSIDQPIVLADLTSLIYNNEGVVSVTNVEIKNVIGEISDRVYSDVAISVKNNTKKNIIFPRPGGIFEVKFPDDDIRGTAS
jgi:hypothetical protein